MMRRHVERQPGMPRRLGDARCGCCLRAVRTDDVGRLIWPCGCRDEERCIRCGRCFEHHRCDTRPKERGPGRPTNLERAQSENGSAAAELGQLRRRRGRRAQD